MSKLEYAVWSDEYSVGVDGLDEQHRKILHLINDLYNMKTGHKNASATWHLLLELQDYSMAHLAEEEAIMRQCGYSDFDRHKNAHDQFRKNTEQLWKSQRDIMGDLSFEVLDHLKKWWRQHILGMDLKYAPCIRNQGVMKS